MSTYYKFVTDCDFTNEELTENKDGQQDMSSNTAAITFWVTFGSFTILGIAFVGYISNK